MSVCIGGVDVIKNATPAFTRATPVSTRVTPDSFQYVVVKYIDEKTAEIAFPNFHLRASQFLVDELEEQPAMSHSFQFLIKQIGVREMFVCLEEALGVASRGGQLLHFHQFPMNVYPLAMTSCRS